MIKRFPQFVEREFTSLCAVEGALCNKAQEDEGGWDFFVEFPIQPLAAPADTHPPRKTAFVQVKSARKHQLTCRVKLSNMLLAAQSPYPWFLVFMTDDTGHRSTRIYAVHIWDQLIRKTLERVRRAENEGIALNKRELTIRFDASDNHGDNLVAWMYDAIKAVEPDYEQQKRIIFQTIGYEESYGIVEVTLGPTTASEVLDNFLGLGSGIPVSRFVYRPARFGILSPEPEFDASSGIIHTTPSPVSICEIRLRGPSTAAPMVLSGHMYSPGIPGLSFAQSRSVSLPIFWRSSGRPLEKRIAA